MRLSGELYEEKIRQAARVAFSNDFEKSRVKKIANIADKTYYRYIQHPAWIDEIRKLEKLKKDRKSRAIDEAGEVLEEVAEIFNNFEDEVTPQQVEKGVWLTPAGAEVLREKAAQFNFWLKAHKSVVAKNLEQSLKLIEITDEILAYEKNSRGKKEHKKEIEFVSKVLPGISKVKAETIKASSDSFKELYGFYELEELLKVNGLLQSTSE